MKSVIRNEVLGNLRRLSREDKVQASLKIQDYLNSELKSVAGTWAGFMPLGNEPEINWSEAAPQLTWVFPVTGQDSLQFKKPTEGFQQAALGIQEPLGPVVSVSDIDGFVIPALGFDQAGYRLGRGNGYYDRTLSGNIKNKIGVCFEVSFLKDIPFEKHDVRCDKIITEKQVYLVNKAEGDQKWN